MTTALSAPVRQNERIGIIDSIRGIALLGILLMNIPYFSNPYMLGSNITVRNELSGPNYYTWWVVEGFFEGTMRALFSMLFGAGCILLLERLGKNNTIDGAKIYYRRLLWLLLFGLINAYIFLWPGDILYSYAICGLFLYPFKDLKAKHLFLIAIVFLLVSTGKGTFQLWQANQMRVQGEKAIALESSKKKLTEEQEAAKAKWVGYQEKIKKENVLKAAKKETETMQQGYFPILSHLSGFVSKFESTKFYHAFFLDCMVMIFLGMAFFKWGILTGKRPKKFYWILMASCYAIGVPLSYFEHSTLIRIGFDFTRAFDAFVVGPYQFRRMFLATGHLSVVMLAYKYGLFKLLYNWLSKVGQMAFTNYLMQTLICITIFYGFGFGLFGKLQRFETYYVVFAIWAFQLIFSNIWLHYFKFGPFEWLWRSLTYWKKQPMKKTYLLPENDETEKIAPALA